MPRGLVFAALLPAAVFAQTVPAPYLPREAIESVQVLPPAPVKGEVRYDADRRIFKVTRKLVGTPRYALATNDVDYAPAAMMRDFSCAAGVVLTPEAAPRTLQLLIRAGRDTSRSAGVAKDYFKRARPYQIDRGAICQPAAELQGSYDYPSGHATWGWTWGTILAELMPDRATHIELRARAYGESRVICGVHNASAVEAGQATASAALAVVRTAAEYQSDLAAARAELAALRASARAPDAAACSTEAALLRQRGY